MINIINKCVFLCGILLLLAWCTTRLFFYQPLLSEFLISSFYWIIFIILISQVTKVNRKLFLYITFLLTIVGAGLNIIRLNNYSDIVLNIALVLWIVILIKEFFENVRKHRKH